MTRLLALAVVCGLAATVAGAATPPALAETRAVLHDGAHDVWKVDQAFPQDNEMVDKPKVDVLRMAVTHRSTAVTVRMKFVDLRRSGWQRYDAKIKTPDRVYVAGMIAHKNLRAGVSDLYRGSNVQQCDGLSHEIDYAADVVVLRVPRSCLGNPDWVRVQGINFLWPNPRDDEHLFADNPHTHAAGAQKSFTERLRHG
jgi:hypothetical protein